MNQIPINQLSMIPPGGILPPASGSMGRMVPPPMGEGSLVSGMQARYGPGGPSPVQNPPAAGIPRSFPPMMGQQPPPRSQPVTDMKSKIQKIVQEKDRLVQMAQNENG